MSVTLNPDPKTQVTLEIWQSHRSGCTPWTWSIAKVCIHQCIPSSSTWRRRQETQEFPFLGSLWASSTEAALFPNLLISWEIKGAIKLLFNCSRAIFFKQAGSNFSKRVSLYWVKESRKLPHRYSFDQTSAQKGRNNSSTPHINSSFTRR